MEITHKYDGELMEINPLVKTVHGKLLALDAKLVIDDNYLFRHPEFKTHQMPLTSDLETKALAEGLNYVHLDGDIGVVGNGAGLTMATMDLLSLYGGKPAGFLDFGGATRKNVSAALKILPSNERVKVVFINVLGRHSTM